MEIIAFQSIGSLAFGDSRQVTKEKLGSSFSTFEKVSGANATDSYDGLGLHLYYDNENRLEFVECFAPAEVVFQGIKFLGRDLQEVAGDMKSLGYFPTETDVGVKFHKAGIAITATMGLVEGIAAFRKGYYD